MPKEDDQRQYKRIPRRFILRFRVRPSEGKECGPGGWDVVTVEDLSAGGALIDFAKELPIGSLLDILITFPLSDQPIKCVGKVLRVEKSPVSPIYKIGVVFEGLDPKDKEMIETLAKRKN